MDVFGNAGYIKARQKASDFSLYDPIPFFRREFTVKKNVVRDAKIFVQAPGFAVFYINGKNITEDIFISPLSDYKKILWYNEYDVTDILRDGVNTVGVIASNGYFNESFETAWHYPKAEWRDAPQFMLCLKINGEDALVSNGEWKTSLDASHIIYSHLRSGEYVDMRKYNPSWLVSGYDDSAWQNAIVRDPSEITGKLCPVDCEPVRECETVEPKEIKRSYDGWLVDFGVTISGYTEITLRAPRGREVIMRYCEDIDGDMRPKHNNMDKPYFYYESPFQINKLIASGRTDTFKPLFSYHGFRYVIIEGLDTEPKKEDIRAFFIHNDVKRKADFVSGNEVLNYIYTAGIRSTYSNMFWSLTDCPTREKLGWMNDAQATAEQAIINFDIVRFYKKWFEDIKADQLDTGEIHGVIPTWGWGLDWGPVCDCCLFELPYRIYLYTGDASMLTGAIPQFEKYIDFLEKMISEDHEFKLGDWMGNGNSKLIPKEFVRDIYLLKVLKTAALAKRLAGIECRTDEARLCELKEAFLQRYLDKSGRCTVDEQTACAMMIMFGLYSDKAVLCRQLVSAVERDGTKLTSGMVGIQYLYDALSECGRADLCYKLITESEPGYKTWYSHGATTLWECWDGADNGSHNHHMFSNVLAWFFKSLLGIAPDENAPAFERVVIAPRFIREIGFVKGFEDTVRGRISAEWHCTDGGFEYTVTLPEGVCGEFDGRALHAGVNTFFIKESKNESN